MYKIAILQRGWVFIGKFSQDGQNCKLENAYNIRRWGTNAGLGQLALQGKQSETKLDKVGTISFHELSSVCLMDVDQEIWKKELES